MLLGGWRNSKKVIVDKNEARMVENWGDLHGQMTESFSRHTKCGITETLFLPWKIPYLLSQASPKL